MSVLSSDRSSGLFPFTVHFCEDPNGGLHLSSRCAQYIVRGLSYVGTCYGVWFLTEE